MKLHASFGLDRRAVQLFAPAPSVAARFPRWLRSASRRRPSTAEWLIPAATCPLTIDKGAILVVAPATRASVTCVRGSLWITHDGDPKDILLGAGDTYTSERSSRMLVQGLAASTALVSHA